MADNTKPPRPVFTNIHVTDIVSYKLPPAGIVSILHRVSGVVMFLLLPFVVWMFDTSLTSEISYDEFKSVFTAGAGILPAILVNVITWGLIWAYLHHFIAGVRHLWMDATHSVSRQQGHSSAIVTLALSVGLTLILGAKLFGLF
ncbi:MAG: succinate dehydrogenase, cytochrome b556 subunit [Aquabacterium sp.]|uniref:succinate dehydrogenase, cytochrome b556 subunit n=1 Tax=Aquabacterium sp. TaxID=1872578 RepID=UPI00271D1C0E|nr:succinate dehydrogenase, cytochrome b556 subunit [Aquabacterium sp.]MDO9005122.1 succinate dehydrogenase, cytochrome b556 subunit [Aquabacterium sp.]